MGATRNSGSEQLLNMSYSDPKNIKNFLRNWGNLEQLSSRGDTVALSILLDLKMVTGIDLSVYDRLNRTRFNSMYKNGCLSYKQFMSLVYTLVLGYSQDDIAYVMGVDRSVISLNASEGIKRIIRALRENSDESKT